MKKTPPITPNKQSEKENRLVMSFDDQAKSLSAVGNMKEKLKVRTKILQDLENKMKTFFKANNITDPKVKSEISHLSDRLEEEILKNQRLEFEVAELKNENKTLGDIIDKLKEQIDQQTTAHQSFEKQEDLHEKIEKLQNELDMSRHKAMSYENLKHQIEELKKEKDKMAIEIDKERVSYETRILELREQLREKEKRLEERITDEHHNKYLYKDNINKVMEQGEKWKKLYMIEAKNVITLQNQYKSVVEDNKCHMQYLAQLESKIQQLEAKYYDLYSDYHERLTEYRIENLRNIQIELEKCKKQLKPDHYQQVEDGMMIYALQSELNKEKEKAQDLKSHLDVLLQTKEELQASLAMARANAIELTEKLEEEISKVAALEDMRITDLQYIASLEQDL